MPSETRTDRQLSAIIVYGFSLAFGLVIASLQALRPTPSGFAIELSGWTLVAFLVGAAIMLPCFRVIVHTRSKNRRRAALLGVVLLGAAAFFYPMRVVPHEKYRPVFIGLAAAAFALSVLAGLLLLLHRFFERDEQQNP
jgi:hypothetical protein